MQVTIGDHTIEVIWHNKKNTFIGTFTSDASKPEIYGDNMQEILDQVEDIIRKEENV